jgi:hypothetical protein
LTINKAFLRIPKDQGDRPGKGSYWAIHPDHQNEFKDGVFTGKIRSSEYRNTPKASGGRRKRKSMASNSDTSFIGHDSSSSLSAAGMIMGNGASSVMHHQPFYYIPSTADLSASATFDPHHPSSATTPEDMYSNFATAGSTANPMNLLSFHSSTNSSSYGLNTFPPYYNTSSTTYYDFGTYPMTAPPNPRGDSPHSWAVNGGAPGHGQGFAPHGVAGACSCSYCLTLPAVSSVSPHPESLRMLDAPSDLVGGMTDINTPPFHYFPSSAGVADSDELEMHKRTFMDDPHNALVLKPAEVTSTTTTEPQPSVTENATQ